MRALAWTSLVQVVVGFAGADGFERVAVDEDFRRAGAGVVLAGHCEAVSAGGEDGQQGTSC